MPRIITRQEGGIVPLGHTSARVIRPSMWLLLHHTGPTGWPKAGWSDAKHMAALQSVSSNIGKTWEYNYVITYPEGWIWEQAGEFQAAHCLNANGYSYGVQINQADDHGPAGQAQVDAFRWLRAWMVQAGLLHPQHQLVPHYGLRSTACSSSDLSLPPGGRRPNSPTGEGSMGSVRPEFLVPWQDAPPPAPGPIPPITPVKPGDDMYSLWADNKAVWAVADDHQTKRWVRDPQQLGWEQALLAINGRPNNVNVALGDATKQTWLDDIPLVSGSAIPGGGTAP